MILTFSDPRDLNKLKLGLCQTLPQIYAEVSAQATSRICMYPQLTLTLTPILLLGRHCFGERSPVSSLLAASNKSFLLPLFGLVVSFGLKPTKRQTQFSGNKGKEEGALRGN